MYNTLDTYDKEALLSGGGKLAGSLWYILPEATTEWWPDAQFRIMAQLRLLSFSITKGATCCLASKNKEECCSERLDLPHLLDCKLGPGRMRPHRAAANAVAKVLRDAGAVVDI